MIGVKMREEDLRQRKAHPVAHHLALGALAALEQQCLAFAHQSHGGDVTLDGWSRCGSAEKRDGKHGGEYKGAGSRERGAGLLKRLRCFVAEGDPLLAPKKP